MIVLLYYCIIVYRGVTDPPIGKNIYFFYNILYMNTILDIYNSVLKYNNNEINFIIDFDGNIWFKFINITKMLNYKSRKDALRLIKKENKQ